MFRLAFIIIILKITPRFSELKSPNKFTVLVSQTKPFAFYENHSLKGLDIEIIRNFARKFNLQIKYVILNESLNVAFSTEKRFEDFTRSVPK